MNLFDQAADAHQRELDQAFAAGEQHARRLLEAPAHVAARVRRGAELDQAYRDGFEACAIYASLFLAIVVVWAFLLTAAGTELIQRVTS